ncbi:AraC family transcriptional regulator [Flavihumibacter solisilvae]|uniref:AraC family transcriptional regulator n=1 Tax=Flavihumibacter solisilvae TaxID=1349421 RepID=A0A0C1L586_9BACT|nr:AraC family transcriptional regulator [Flavihumibacter solisilvae]KIC95277.1 AraC family transcriptional regulator [Flavihumibacter solisilvae]
MKPILEKLPLAGNDSFLARTFTTPNFEVPWHQHPELELILFLEGEGSAYAGNHVGSFSSGDIYFLGSNLPHTFQKARPGMMTSAVVVQFLADFWGKELLQLPESRELRTLFETAKVGLKIKGELLQPLARLVKDLEHAAGFDRLLLLCQCLSLIASKKEYDQLSSHHMASLQTKQQQRMDRIFQYTIDHFSEGISLDEIASFAGMSVPAFCNYFRKRTKKTYVEFLNEVRIGKACQLLIDTTNSVAGIAYECGFNTLANFNKQFLKVSGTQPGLYRKKFSESSLL